jgi:1,4-alpha-glucan branching enzyme
VFVLTKASANRPAGFLTFTLHAHLPYVVNHGTWPHGMEWLHEAAAETYLPFLRMLKNLERDNIRFNCNLNLSPILLEQLSHPVFIAEFPNYLNRKIVAAREDEAFFIQSGETHLAETARFWHRFFTQALDDFFHFERNIIAAFRHFNDIGLIDIITCGTTHGYMPLLGTDESVRAQVRTAVDTHIRHIGKHPRGIWAPECGYRPAGFWNYPVEFADGSPKPPGFDRIGVEQALAESDLEFFFVDTHLVEEGHRVPSPYELLNGAVPTDEQIERMTHEPYRSLYQPYFVDGPYGGNDKRHAVSIFPRDPRTGVQVWSGDTGYPGDGVYLDFHKKRWPGGHRYWRVTGHKVDMGDKLPYYPQQAAERVKAHASNFIHLVYEALKSGFNDPVPPILCSPFDAELFGHWWFEGPQFLRDVLFTLNRDKSVQLLTTQEVLERHPPDKVMRLPEGSWGKNGDHSVWLNEQSKWIWEAEYRAEGRMLKLLNELPWRTNDKVKEMMQRAGRQLLLLQASDWPFVVHSKGAVDYGIQRFAGHVTRFDRMTNIAQDIAAGRPVDAVQKTEIDETDAHDDVFPEIDLGWWA